MMKMANRRKRKNKTARTLKVLIGVLSLVLILLIGAVFMLENEQEPNSTDGPTESTPPLQTETQPTETTVPPVTGWQTVDGKTYYYGDDSVLRTGVVLIDGSIYCFDETGALLPRGWQTVGEKTYYLNENGTAYLGWLELDGKRYYLKEDGTLARGEVEIDGEKWFFTSTGAQIYVVNPWNYIPDDYDPELTALSSTIAHSNAKVTSECYGPLMQMIKDCQAAGHNIYIVSSYRTMATQEALFERQVNKQIAAFGYSREEAEKVAATISAIPGTSEHQLGLAVDIIDTKIWDLVEEQEDLPGQQWLMEHCWEYGFILRYPKDKTGETGIIYEPWHYRYVGTELAAELHELGVTLEEYIASLS